jgi:hypothetical protein
MDSIIGESDTEQYLEYLGVFKWEEHENNIEQSRAIQSLSRKEAKIVLDSAEKEYTLEYETSVYLVENGLYSKEDRVLAAHFVTTTKLELAKNAEQIEQEIMSESRKISRQEPGIITRTGTAAWNLIVYLGGLLWSLYEYGWSLVKWIFYHPTITNIILRMFMLVKKKICEYFYGDITESGKVPRGVSFKWLLKQFKKGGILQNEILESLFNAINWSVNEFGTWMNACEHELSKSLTSGFSFLQYFAPGWVYDAELYGWMSGTLVWNTMLSKMTWNLGVIGNWIMTPIIKDKLARLFLTGCEGFLNFGECGIPLIPKQTDEEDDDDEDDDDSEDGGGDDLDPDLANLAANPSKFNVKRIGDSEETDEVVQFPEVKLESLKYPAIEPPKLSSISSTKQISKQIIDEASGYAEWYNLLPVYGAAVMTAIIIPLYRRGRSMLSIYNAMNNAGPDIINQAIQNPESGHVLQQFMEMTDDEMTEEVFSGV